MKSSVALVLSVVVWGLLLAGTALGGSPDSIGFFCVDESDRANVRTARDDCDVLATGMGYHAGVLTMCSVVGGIDPCPVFCTGGRVVYECLGVPGTRE